MKTRAFTLIEILIAVAICSIVFGPLYIVFSSSRKNILHAQGTSIATSYSSSMLAALKQVDYKDLKTLSPTEDQSLPSPYQISELGISNMPENYKRFLTIDKMDLSGVEGGPYFLATVEISWKPRTINRLLSYRILSFLSSSIDTRESEK